MPWGEVSTMSLRQEFVRLALQEGANRRELCRRFGVSPTTGYKWIQRYLSAGNAGLRDQSRRPHHSPGRLPPEMEQPLVDLRDDKPAWGARKLRRRLMDLGHEMPAISTCHAVLQRHNLIPASAGQVCRPMQRFERPHPNELWQMDFKGDFLLGTRERCFPLTIIDDHSRFSPCVQACPNQQEQTVRQALTGVFERYGLPDTILADNGSPWGYSEDHPQTRLTLWLLRLDIPVRHGRPYHPQTQGKEERFNRTFKDEVLRIRAAPLDDFPTAQKAFNRFRDCYNFERPHQALDDQPPITRYEPSPRTMPSTLPPLAYPKDARMRKVIDARFCFHGHTYRIGKPFSGEHIGLSSSDEDGVWSVYYGPYIVASLDERIQHLEKRTKLHKTI